MNKQSKRGLLFLAVWALAILAAFLRRGLYLHAVDARGLLISRHPLEIALWAVVLAGVAVIIGIVWKLDGSNAYEENFDASASAALGYFLLAYVIGMMVLLNNFQGTDQIARLQRILGAIAVPGLVWGGIRRIRGKMPFFGIHVVLCLFLLLYLISWYQLWSGNPQLQDYVFDLLAAVALILFSYQCAAFEAGVGKRNMQLGFGLTAILFCGAALGRTEMTGLFAAGMVWAVTDLCRLAPPPKKEEVEHHDPS